MKGRSNSEDFRKEWLGELAERAAMVDEIRLSETEYTGVLSDENLINKVKAKIGSNFSASMLEGYAEYYSAELSQKIRRGMNESRQKGNYTGGYVLYGYKIVDKKVVIDEYQAEIVRYIYEQYSTGVYVKDILKALNEKGVIHRGKPFASNTIYGILKNEKYSGSYKRGNEIFEKTFPRIVPQEVFEKVRKSRAKQVWQEERKRTVFITF